MFTPRLLLGLVLITTTVSSMTATARSDLRTDRFLQPIEKVDPFSLLSPRDSRQPNCESMHPSCPPVLANPLDPRTGGKWGETGANIRMRLVVSHIEHEIVGDGMGVDTPSWVPEDRIEWRTFCDSPKCSPNGQSYTFFLPAPGETFVGDMLIMDSTLVGDDDGYKVNCNSFGGASVSDSFPLEHDARIFLDDVRVGGFYKLESISQTGVYAMSYSTDVVTDDQGSARFNVGGWLVVGCEENQI